ncbi:high mobility group protein 1 homolog [Centruroides vittatus]|uniref:high mobility group protein 1 homolog n=1 Tax=Centruroides vittatus TaxID=120091 RepID=UPI00350FF3A8
MAPRRKNRKNANPESQFPRTWAFKRSYVRTSDYRRIRRRGESESKRFHRKQLRDIKKLTKFPNRPASSFLLYFRDHQGALRSEKKWKITKVAKTLGRKWKTLDQNTKNGYLNKAKEDCNRYRNEKRALRPLVSSPTKLLKYESRPYLPKKNVPSFMFFFKNTYSYEREKNPELKVWQLAKQLGRKWNGMKREEKETYLEMAERDRERYYEQKKALAHLHSKSASSSREISHFHPFKLLVNDNDVQNDQAKYKNPNEVFEYQYLLTLLFLRIVFDPEYD